VPPYGDYSVVLPIRGFARLAEAAMNAELRLKRQGRHDDALKVRAAYREYLDDLRKVATRVAAYAQTAIRQEEASSRVRPDTGGDGGPRLQTALGLSRPIPQLPGSVAINDENALRAAGAGWWWTNEFGYSGHIGRVVHGFFYDVGFKGRSRPGAEPSRTHPLFRPEGFQRPSGYRQAKGGVAFHRQSRKQPKGRRPGMLIQEPIPARRFLLRGWQRAERLWHREVERERQAFLRRLAQIGP
jgi:hypothetical protein